MSYPRDWLNNGQMAVFSFEGGAAIAIGVEALVNWLRLPAEQRSTPTAVHLVSERGHLTRAEMRRYAEHVEFWSKPDRRPGRELAPTLLSVVKL